MDKNIFTKMTKDEIITWIRGSAMFISNPPRMSDILFARWQVQAGKVQVKRTKHIESFKDLDLKKRDSYAKQFNASKNAEERIQLLKKMKPYETKLQKHHEEYKKLEKEQKKVDRLYESIEKEEGKE
jgi:hypothetical protein